MVDGHGTSGRGPSVVGIVLIGLGAFLLTLAVALAFVVVPAQKRTPLNVEATTVTETVRGAIFVGKAFAGNEPTQKNRSRAECRVEGDKKLPITCFIDNDIDLYSQRHVVMVEPSDADRSTFQAAQSVLRGSRTGGSGSVNDLVSASIDRVTTDRVTGAPVDEAVSTTALLSSGDPSKDPAPKPYVRGGIQYKFPFDTEKRDYPYFDLNTFTTNPIVFKEESEVNGVKAFVFEQKLGPIDMWSSIRKHYTDSGDTENAERILASYRIRDLPAERWGLSGDPKRVVDMRRFYTNSRTLYVNPETGQIVNGREDIHQFFAENQQQADAFFADKSAVASEQASPRRTAVRLAAGWSPETIAATSERVEKNLGLLNTFGRIVPGLLGVLGVLSLGAGIFLGVRRRR